MKHGKIVGGAFILAPTTIKIVISNPSREQYTANGYLPVRESEMPVNEGFYYIPSYAEEDGVIVQSWQEHEIPQEDADLEQRVENLEETVNDMLGGDEDEEGQTV